MTRLLKIVNMSDHEGEDYLVHGQQGLMLNDGSGAPDVTLAPGESCFVVDPDGINPVDVRVLAKMRADVYQPFTLNGQQVFPFMEVGWR